MQNARKGLDKHENESILTSEEGLWSFVMSTAEEIAEVYASDINRMTKIVYNKQGIAPFLAGLTGYYTFRLYDRIPCSDKPEKLEKKR